MTGLYKSSYDFCKLNKYLCIFNILDEAFNIAIRFQANVLFIEQFIYFIKPYINISLIGAIEDDLNLPAKRKNSIINLLKSDHVFSLKDLLKFSDNLSLDIISNLPKKFDNILPGYIEI